MLKLIKSLSPIFLFTGCTYWYVPSQPHFVNDELLLANDSIQTWISENSSPLREEGLWGKYTYPVSGCFFGYTLELTGERTFTETIYSDVPNTQKVFRGKYNCSNDTLILKYRRLFKNEYEFKVLMVDSSVYLVPLVKLDRFYESISLAKKTIRDTVLTAKELKKHKCDVLNEICFFKTD